FGGVIFLLLMGFLTGCKCDDPTNPECPNYCGDETNPECPNYNPCWDQVPVSADFKIEELIQGRRVTRTETDTLIYYLLLTGPAGVLRYEWHIGNDPRVFTGREVFLNFSDADSNSIIPVVLVVEGVPNKTCFPEDSGKDTVRRDLFITTPCKSRMVGKFRGVLKSNPVDTFTVEITCEYDFTGVSDFDIWGIPKTCIDTPYVKSMNVGGGYVALRVYASSPTACNYIEGVARLKNEDRDSLLFPFTLGVSANLRSEFFYAKRLKN
ncbi:MAG: hypothetical protein SF052_24615, partial [Bacteroidia bacterium]|nr:hypothetical protein [Bacteroidia bacterium]